MGPLGGGAALSSWMGLVSSKRLKACPPFHPVRTQPVWVSSLKGLRQNPAMRVNFCCWGTSLKYFVVAAWTDWDIRSCKKSWYSPHLSRPGDAMEPLPWSVDVYDSISIWSVKGARLGTQLREGTALQGVGYLLSVQSLKCSAGLNWGKAGFLCRRNLEAAEDVRAVHLTFKSWRKGGFFVQSQEKDRTPDGNGDQAFSAWLYLRDRVLSSYKSNSVSRTRNNPVWAKPSWKKGAGHFHDLLFFPSETQIQYFECITPLVYSLISAKGIVNTESSQVICQFWGNPWNRKLALW